MVCFQVLREGEIRVGDEVRSVGSSPDNETVAEMARAVKRMQP